ncbi:MAG: methionine adenosyltransferase [Sphaerochaetaceae bacterium]
MSTLQLFTSESVSEGHPDKVCDQIADAVLDSALSQDPSSKVACEVMATTNKVVIAGEITTKAQIDYEHIVRSVVKEIGYTEEGRGFDYKNLKVMVFVDEQSLDIDKGVDATKNISGKQGAGDQGMMFGYACSETPSLMPAPITYAHKLLQQAAHLRKQGDVDFLLPDAKAQVTLAYDHGKPIHIDTIVVSHQHTEHVSLGTLQQYIKERVITPALRSTGLLTSETKYFINPTGRFVVGGPTGDTGLTGRKIIVDTYGGMGRHGGGAFSGKDPSKVDRSGAYMARLVAKNLVGWGLCTRCEVQISYAIGVADPVALYVETYGTATIDEQQIINIINREFDLSPSGIIERLDLKRPIYQAHMNYGHFGKEGVSWEELLDAPLL